jgi:hypothetical protein
MLRSSIEYSGRDAHLLGISQGALAGDTGIAHGEGLVTFATAGVAGDVADLATAPGANKDAAGSGALVELAAVVGNFQGMVRIGIVRIADGEGIPLDGVTLALTSGLREDLGIEKGSSRRMGGSAGL